MNTTIKFLDEWIATKGVVEVARAKTLKEIAHLKDVTFKKV